jgi:5-methylcytosine-specific restriction endonuclease McrA
MYEGGAKAVDSDYMTYDFESWAEISAQEHESHVLTATLKLRVPEVIVLSKYNDIPDRKLAFSRANLYKRDMYTCQYCGVKPEMKELTIEHIVPRSKGGQSTWTNCVLACWSCNAKKADKSLAECAKIGLILRTKPVKPNWSPRLTLGRVKNTPKSWEKFVNDAYWNVELEQ